MYEVWRQCVNARKFCGITYSKMRAVAGLNGVGMVLITNSCTEMKMSRQQHGWRGRESIVETEQRLARDFGLTMEETLDFIKDYFGEALIMCDERQINFSQAMHNLYGAYGTIKRMPDADVRNRVAVPLPKTEVAATRTISELQGAIHKNAVEKGFWEGGDRNDGESIALIHSELSEALEALRSGNPESEKLGAPFTHVEEELADAIIRILDLAGGRGWDIEGAVEAKMEYNAGRPYKHGREF